MFTDSGAFLVLFQRRAPFTNPLKTQRSRVDDIPYFVTDRFMYSYVKRPDQMKRVDAMVEAAYEQFLIEECYKQQEYRQRSRRHAERERNAQKRAELLKQADEVQLKRCMELVQLYPRHKGIV